MGTPIFDRLIEHESAWTRASVGGREGLELKLPRGFRKGVDSLLDRNRSKPLDAITRADFEEDVVSEVMAGVRKTVLEGRGAAVLSGLDISDYSVEDLERIYLGLGTHIGRPAYQSPARDLVGHVRKAPSSTPRGYLTDLELKPHADSHEILSLLTVRKGETGGVSGLVSSLAMHNKIFQTRPELLAALYEGFYYGAHETRPIAEPITKTKVPVYCCVDGKVSCMINGFFMMTGARRMGVELPGELKEAMAYFYSLSEDPDLIVRFMMEPGEMMFWSNYTNLHARTAYQDTPENTRLLLRLWLDPANGRPVVPEFLNAINNRYDEEVRAELAA
jgi:hypothetical protein